MNQQYSTTHFRPSGAAAPDLSHLVPPALIRAEAKLLACVQALALDLVDDWDDCVQYALDGVQDQLDGIRQAIEDAPGNVLEERMMDYQEDDR